MKCAEYKVSMVRECELEYKAKLRDSSTVIDFWHAEIEKASWYDSEKEMCVVVLLSAKNHIKGYNLVSIGSINSSIVAPREVFRPAIIGGAVAVILCHNHPSGDTTPSAEDIRITKQLVEAGKIVDIGVLDHVIVSNASNESKGYTSLRETGVVEF